MKIISWNVKGITDPKKAKSINKWLRDSHQNVDVVCLQEIKASGETAKQRLQAVHPKFIWFHTANSQGTGGAAIGINPKLQLQDIMLSNLPSPNWVGVKIGGASPLTVVSVYAGGSTQSRADMWQELSGLQGPVILSGDFNMVEFIEDRWEGKGVTIKGSELTQWEALKNSLDLTDIGDIGKFTWQNYSAPPMARKARLDKTFVLTAVANKYIRVKIAPNFNTCLFDHHPIIISLDNKANKARSNWFHTKLSLFQLASVQEAIKVI